MDDSTDRLFVYGTLQYPDLLQHLLGRTPPLQPAILRHYARYTIQNERYPGIIPENGQQTEGSLIIGIQPHEWERLDQYEDDLYERHIVHVFLENGAQTTAQAYIIPEHHRAALSNQPWQKSRSNLLNTRD